MMPVLDCYGSLNVDVQIRIVFADLITYYTVSDPGLKSIIQI